MNNSNDNNSVDIWEHCVVVVYVNKQVNHVLLDLILQAALLSHSLL